MVVCRVKRIRGAEDLQEMCISREEEQGQASGDIHARNMSPHCDGQAWVIKIDVQNILFAMSECCVWDATRIGKGTKGSSQEAGEQHWRYDKSGTVTDDTAGYEASKTPRDRVPQGGGASGECIPWWWRRGENFGCYPNVSRYVWCCWPESWQQRQPRSPTNGVNALEPQRAQRVG